MMAIFNRATDAVELIGALLRCGFLAPLRPDRYVRIAAAIRRENLSAITGFAMSAQRCPERLGLVDELGALTWRQIDERSDAFAAALQGLPGGQPRTVGVMCRNHRGFVEAVIACHRIGADVVLLNTSFAGLALAEVINREGVDAVVYDEEFTEIVGIAVAGHPDMVRIVGWTDEPPTSADLPTIEQLVVTHIGAQPKRTSHKPRLILLTSGTTGIPKGAQAPAGDPTVLTAVLDRTPWHTEETVVVAAPMFHAWGFSQLVFAAMLACTIVMRRKFDPEATLDMVDRNRATGLSLVPVMFDRIMELPADVRGKYSCATLRFAAASGSRMRPDVVIAFMDEFGDVIYNNYNATEAGLIASATPQDLRIDPGTAGKPLPGTEVRVLDDGFDEVQDGEVGRIYCRSRVQFDGYTSGTTKDFHDGFMASGDVGYFDANGRLFVVGRDDEMIVSGGENVYPIEAEKVLATHPGVADVAVIGIDDAKYGQRLAAFVVLREGAAASEDSLKAHVRESLGNHKVPRQVTVLDELPRNITGKIVRADLHARVESP